jgi:transposase
LTAREASSLGRMANVLDSEKQQQILALGRLGWTLRRIEQETGIRRETVSRYLKQAGIEVRPPGRWGHPAAKPAKEVITDSGADSKPAIEVFTDSVPPPVPGRSPTVSACEPHREWIEVAVRHGRDAMAIWQDLVDDWGFTHSYQSVRRFVVKLRGERVPEAHPIIQTAPGEEGQVDYGDGPMVRDPESGKYRRTRLFVFTLGCSRKSVRFLTFQSSSKIWAELHERSFRCLGGAPRVTVLDNLKEGVLKPDLYDPALNPLYRDVLAHYGVMALPCRVRDPNRKGKVESGVNHVQRKLKGLRFENLEEAQSYLDRWETNWADTRIHGTTKRQVAAMFTEEKPHLLPLPVEPFRYYPFGDRTVHLAGAVEVDGAYYHVPPGRIGQRLRVQWDGLHVRILCPKTGELLREHVRQKKGYHRMRDEDRPKKTPESTARLLSRACNAGESIGIVCQAIHHMDGETGVRRILGVLSLVKQNGASAVEPACAMALEMELPTYQFVRRYLERQPTLPLSLKQVDPLIRELTHYRDLVDRRIEGEVHEHD